MPDELLDAAVAESSPAQPTADPSQSSPNGAAPQTTDQNGAGPKSRNFDQHPRFQQLIRENRESRTQNQQLTQTVQQLNQRLQQLERTATGPAYTPEQRQERGQAIQALKALMQEDPELAQLLAMRQAFPNLMQGYQGVQQITQAQKDATVRGGRQEIASLVQTAGLPTDAEGASERYEDIITGIISRDPDMTQRFRAGDTSVIREAFAIFQSFIAPLQRPAAAGLANTKAQTKRLPPRATGGSPSDQEAPAKLVPGQEREFERSLHERAMSKLGSLLTG